MSPCPGALRSTPCTKRHTYPAPALGGPCQLVLREYVRPKFGRR